MNANKYYGLQDARGLRGVFSRGKNIYSGPGNAPNVGNINNIQKAAQRRIKKMQDKRKFR